MSAGSGKIRSDRTELLEDPRFAGQSDGAIRLWTGLKVCWDDYGRSLGSIGFIRGRVYFARPKSPTLIGRELAELEANGWVKRYQVAGVDYLCVPGWNDPESATFQYVKHKTRSRLPAPPLDSGAQDGARNGAQDGAQDGSTDVDQGSGIGDQGMRNGREPARAIPPSTPAPPAPPSPAAPPPAPTPLLPVVAPPPAPEAVAQQPPTAAPTLDQLWTELEQARQRAAAHHRVTLGPLLAHDARRHDLAGLLVEASRVGQRPRLVGQIRHAIAVAESEAIADRDQLQWLSGAVFSERNFGRLCAAPLPKRAGPKSTAAARDPAPPPKELADPCKPGDGAMALETLLKRMTSNDDTPDHQRRKASQ